MVLKKYSLKSVHKGMISGEMKFILGGVLTDLHAADTRYHDCRTTFTGTNNIKSAQGAEMETIDEAYNEVIQYVQSEKSNYWKSTKLHVHYMTIFYGDV